MKKLTFLLVVLSVSALSSLIFAATPLAQEKNFESNILKLDCSVFDVTGTGTSEMSVGTAPNDWVTATNSVWTSSNCYPANITSPAHIKKSVQFGSSFGTASATTPSMDLSPITGMRTKVRIVITAGANKTGSLAVKLNGNTIGTISAASSAPGNTNFGGFYYSFEYDITDTGTSSSSLTFEHSSTEALGYLYLREISMYREAPAILKLNCSLFSANSTSILSTATYPNNWTASLGANPFSTAYCYAQNNIGSTYGPGIRMGASSNVNVGSFTTNELNLASSSNYKNKFYVEIMVTSVATIGTKLNMKVDNGDAQWIYDPLLDNGSGEPVTAGAWVPYEGEITEGTASSKITFFQTRNASEITSIYIRDLRIYHEYPDVTTVENKFMKNSIRIYPNPCVNELYTDAEYILIFNLTGTKLMQGKVNNGIVNLSSLPAGAYFVNCLDKDGSHSVHKIIKN